MSDDKDIIDVEAVEIEDSDNLPAVVTTEATHGAEPPIEGRDWSKYSTPERRCTAHSSRTGDRCKNVSIKGGKVCRYHGGNAPHVIANARARLQNAADLMARELLGIALTADGEGVKLAAIKDALDRAGLKPPAEVVLSQGESKPYETVFDSIGGTAPDESSDPSSGYGSAGHTASPAPAYDTSGNGGKAEAGESVADMTSTSWHGRSKSSDREPPRQPSPREDDREPQPQRRHGAPQWAAPHITGDAAIRLANEANRQAGTWEPQRELESPHRRYRDHRQ